MSTPAVTKRLFKLQVNKMSQPYQSPNRQQYIDPVLEQLLKAITDGQGSRGVGIPQPGIGSPNRNGNLVPQVSQQARY